MIEKLWKNLSPRNSRLVKMIWSAFTMFFIGFGIYLQIEADIGFPSWNALNQGFSYNLRNRKYNNRTFDSAC